MTNPTATTNPLISRCPVCAEAVTVRVLSCESCETELHGRFSLPRLARLPRELQDVVEVFLGCRGNIKQVEKQLGISYPTVCRKLDAINTLLRAMGSGGESRTRILRQLDAGELTTKQALALLRELE